MLSSRTLCPRNFGKRSAQYNNNHNNGSLHLYMTNLLRFVRETQKKTWRAESKEKPPVQPKHNAPKDPAKVSIDTVFALTHMNYLAL